jgi:hypothetical protein
MDEAHQGQQAPGGRTVMALAVAAAQMKHNAQFEGGKLCRAKRVEDLARRRLDLIRTILSVSPPSTAHSALPRSRRGGQ